MIRKMLTGGVLVGMVLAGLVVQAGSFLLALPAPPATVDTPLADDDRGVGVRRIVEAPLPLTVWYPAVDPVQRPLPLAYTYGINAVGSGASVALATYSGRAVPGADADRVGAPYPLVILSHGFAVGERAYAWMSERLASQGFVVVAPTHSESLDPSTLWRSTIQRPLDIRAVLDLVEMGDDPLWELVGSGPVGVVGHSYGGFTALAAGGARVDTAGFDDACETAGRGDGPLAFLCASLEGRMAEMAAMAGLQALPEGLWPATNDSRVGAVVSLAGDAAMFGPDGLARLELPLLVIGGTADTDSPFEWSTELAFEHAASSRKIEMALTDAGHMVFAGRCESARRIFGLAATGFCDDGAWDRREAQGLVGDLVATFLVAELTDDDPSRALLAQAPGVSEATYRQVGYP